VEGLKENGGVRAEESSGCGNTVADKGRDTPVPVQQPIVKGKLMVGEGIEESLQADRIGSRQATRSFAEEAISVREGGGDVMDKALDHVRPKLPRIHIVHVGLRDVGSQRNRPCWAVRVG
jgi:hypothetical protein